MQTLINKLPTAKSKDQSFIFDMLPVALSKVLNFGKVSSRVLNFYFTPMQTSDPNSVYCAYKF